MASSLAESRDDIMVAPDLFRLLAEKTADEYKSKWEKGHMQPPVGGIALTLILTVILFFFKQKTPAYIFLVLTILQGVWVFTALCIRTFTAVAEKQESIRAGNFPKEAAALVYKRLRWWNHLIVPLNWARHSRIHERKYKLEQRIQALQNEINRIQAEQDQAQGALKNLPDAEILNIAARITNMAERQEYEARVRNLSEELPRLEEEMNLYRALLLKVLEVTNKLDRIEQLGFVAKQDDDNLRFLAEDACAMLQERRALVREVDTINPDEFLDLVKV